MLPPPQMPAFSTWFYSPPSSGSLRHISQFPYPRLDSVDPNAGK